MGCEIFRSFFDCFGFRIDQTVEIQMEENGATRVQVVVPSCLERIRAIWRNSSFCIKCACVSTALILSVASLASVGSLVLLKDFNNTNVSQSIVSSQQISGNIATIYNDTNGSCKLQCDNEEILAFTDNKKIKEEDKKLLSINARELFNIEGAVACKGVCDPGKVDDDNEVIKIEEAVVFNGTFGEKTKHAYIVHKKLTFALKESAASVNDPYEVITSKDSKVLSCAKKIMEECVVSSYDVSTGICNPGCKAFPELKLYKTLEALPEESKTILNSHKQFFKKSVCMMDGVEDFKDLFFYTNQNVYCSKQTDGENFQSIGKAENNGGSLFPVSDCKDGDICKMANCIKVAMRGGCSEMISEKRQKRSYRNITNATPSRHLIRV